MMRTILLATLLAACGSDSPAPSVHVEGVTPDTLQMSNDAMNDTLISISYSDSDGDLGMGTAEIHDCRADALVTTLAIPAIASADRVAAHDPISGKMDLYVTDVGPAAAGALPQTCHELGVPALADGTTVMCVVLVDVAGHRGTGDCTQTITLMP